MFRNHNIIITGGTFTYITHPVQLRDARKILAQSIAKGARHYSAERYDARKYHPNAHVAIIEEIMDWINSPLDSDQPKIKWLNGAAGAGKSAIMQTVAVSCDDKGTLGGSFFFKRSDPQRGVAERLISTLAYQLCNTFPAIRPDVEDEVNQDSTFLSLLLSTQFTNLILNPLRAKVHELKKPVVIIIDGLDECDSHQDQKHIINLLVEMANHSSSPAIPFRFLIASRRESQIVSAFSSASESTSTSLFTEINLIHSHDVDKDIQLYMNAKFEVIRRKRGIPLGWPAESDLDHILELSSGQFIFSSTVISHVDSDDHHPRVRLQQILQRIPYSTDENPFASLDALYSHIFSELPQSHLATVKQILPIYLNEDVSYLWGEARPRHLSTNDVASQCRCGSRVHHQDVRTIERVLGLPEGDIKIALRHLSAVVSCEYDDEIGGHQIRVHHPSLGDFLNAEDRAGRFFLGDHHTQRQNLIGRVLSAAFRPFLKDDIKRHDIHVTRFDTNCRCATHIHDYQHSILQDYFADRLNPERPPLRDSDIQIFSQIDFAKMFDERSPINRFIRFRYIHYTTDYPWQQQQTNQLKESGSTFLLALNNFVRHQLLSNYRPSLSCDFNAGDILQLFLIFKDIKLDHHIELSNRPIPGDPLFVENVLKHGGYDSGYCNLLSSCAQVIIADPSSNGIVSDPAYQLKLVRLLLWIVADGRRDNVLEKYQSTRDFSSSSIVNRYNLFCNVKRVLDKLLPKAAFSPEVVLLSRVMIPRNAVIEREAENALQDDYNRYAVDMVTLREALTINDGIEDYRLRHKYCDETCRKARHDTLVEQIYRAWKDWNEDLKRYGPYCKQVIIPPLKALFYILQLLDFIDILRNFKRILARYHIISNPDMVVYDPIRDLMPILNLIFAWVLFRT